MIFWPIVLVGGSLVGIAYAALFPIIGSFNFLSWAGGKVGKIARAKVESRRLPMAVAKQLDK